MTTNGWQYTSLTKSAQADVIALRETIHRFPELAFEEFRTAEAVERTLNQYNVEYRRVAGTGIVARVPGRRSGGPVAIRGDMDALPINQIAAYDGLKSEVPGKMHACGHDVHTAWALGAVLDLIQNPADVDVLAVFQPAEEVMKGARALLETGVLDPVKAIFGAHVDRNFELGQVVVQEGAVAAASDRFAIRVEGRFAHGARPHQGDDSIVAAAALVTAIQTIASRKIDPSEPVVVTVGTISGGSAANVIAGEATLTGTVRSTTVETQNRVIEALQTMCDGIGSAYGVKIDLVYTLGVPPVRNLSPCVDWVRDAVARRFGANAVKRLQSVNMASEDFAVYLERIPGAFVRVGVREKGGLAIPAHSPDFYVGNEAVPMGIAVLADAAREASKYL
ncbi:amidohydrolase [bacterium]|nr:amidohydrolase [bacterium]